MPAGSWLRDQPTNGLLSLCALQTNDTGKSWMKLNGKSLYGMVWYGVNWWSEVDIRPAFPAPLSTRSTTFGPRLRNVGIREARGTRWERLICHAKCGHMATWKYAPSLSSIYIQPRLTLFLSNGTCCQSIGQLNAIVLAVLWSPPDFHIHLQPNNRAYL